MNIAQQSKVIKNKVGLLRLAEVGRGRDEVLRLTELGRLDVIEAADLIAHWRLHDWLRLLGFDAVQTQFACYRPDLTSMRWFQRLEWLESTGARAWSILGSVYAVMATKRVHGMRLLSPAWKTSRARRAKTASAASREMK